MIGKGGGTKINEQNWRANYVELKYKMEKNTPNIKKIHEITSCQKC